MLSDLYYFLNIIIEPINIRVIGSNKSKSIKNFVNIKKYS